jgi:hypothetical protein
MFDYEEYLIYEKDYHYENPDIFLYYNAHPNNKNVGDCVKRAIALCSNMDYQTVQKELNRYKQITNAKKFNDTKNFQPYVEKVLKWERLNGYNNIKVGEFAKQYRTGTYLIKIRKHLTAVVDGVIYDTWNCSYKAINKVWRVS